MTILIEINNGQPDTFDVVSFYSLIFFRILALENIAKILTTGPMLFITNPGEENKIYLSRGKRAWIGRVNPPLFWEID